ncbi:UPF0488 protein C8orf33 homolog isoform X2 [Brachyhypopomus gauderio]|uniref:UPF0488 protein C8orf33 homolog isoform X2 n=1 Tax=Brachyhypopomus gauderio TaxID=698409 RepID=UPI00404261C1
MQEDRTTSTGTEHGSKPDVGVVEGEDSKVATSLNTEPITDSSNTKAGKKKKKKKTKKEDEEGGKESTQRNTSKMEDAPKQEGTELTPQQQLSRELDWCIEQLELGLRTQKSSSKQREEATRALKTLRSSKAPTVKKRQVMRAVSGDYRRKMEEERDRQFRLIHSAMTSARVAAVSEPSRKPVFCCHASSKKQKSDGTENPQDTHGLPLSVEPAKGDTDIFVFRPSHEEFRFNFDL